MADIDVNISPDVDARYTAGVKPRYGRPIKTVAAYLRMAAIAGDYPIPTSEDDYQAHLAQIDVAIPMNGGELESDGTWSQNSNFTTGDWPQGLKARAVAAGHIYTPMVSCDTTGVLTVLGNEALMDTAVSNLMTLALTTRFDAPWDGIHVDFEGIGSAYQAQLSTFYNKLRTAATTNGLLLTFWVQGRTADSGSDPDDWYSHDFATLANVADQVYLSVYSYWQPAPKSTGPYWHVIDAIDYALAEGITAQQITLTLGNFCIYMPADTAPTTTEDTVYSQGLTIAGANLEWISSNVNGAVREYFADTGPGNIWIPSALSTQYRLNLADIYQIREVSIFALGMGDPAIWSKIHDWRSHISSEPDEPQVSSVTIQAANDTVGIDTYINSGAPNTNFGTNTKIGIGESNAAAAVWRALIKFDLTQVPAGATVTSAYLAIKATDDNSSNARTLRVYRLLRAWVEGQATWNIYSTGNSWQTAGGFGALDCEQTDIGSLALGAAEGLQQFKEITLDVTAIQAMVDGDFTNNGFLLKVDTESDDAYQYQSSGSATASDHPKLVIYFTV